MKDIPLNNTPSFAFNNLLVDKNKDAIFYVSNGQIVSRHLSTCLNGSLEDENEIQNLSDYEIKDMNVCMNGRCLAATCEKGVLVSCVDAK